MLYETKKVKAGVCPVCGRPYGYEKEIHSGVFVNEYSDCICDKTAYEKDIYRMYQESLKEYKKEGDAVA